MGKKGKLPVKGVGEIWTESKSENLSLRLTPTGKRLARKRAEQEGLSLAEVVELYGRGSINVEQVEGEKRITPQFVINSLKTFTKEHLAEFISIASKLLVGNYIEIEHSVEYSIADLVKKEVDSRYSKDVAAFASDVALPIERVNALLNGEYPSDLDLISIATFLTKDDGSTYTLEEVITIRKSFFGNGHTSGEEMRP